MRKKVIKNLSSPIIVCGMHRSGTTLISKVLNQMGVFMGNDLEENHEPLSFMLLNDELLAYSHSFWDQIEGAFYFYDNKKAVDQASELLKLKLHSNNLFKNYFGSKKNIEKHKEMWGWKDPRNTITFPLWNNVFPEAKLIFIYRNGIDAAASIVHREKKQSYSISTPAYSSRCLNYKNAFKLWEDYNQFYLKYKRILKPSNILEIKYEDFLIQPKNQLESIANFVDVKYSQENKEAIVKSIKADRAYSFKTSNDLIELYESLKNNEVMINLNYGDLLDE